MKKCQQQVVWSLRGVKKTHERTSPTSAVKSGYFSAEVCQLLWSGFSGEFVEAYRSTRPLGSKDAWTFPEGRVRLGKWTAGCEIGLEGFPIPPLR